MHAKTVPEEAHRHEHPKNRHAGYCRSSHSSRQHSMYGKMCVECKKIGHFIAWCRSRRTRAINEVEQETVQNDARENIELVSINSIHFNKTTPY